MSDFNKAVQFVHDTLKQHDTAGRKPRASRSALEKLVAARPAAAAKPIPQQPASNPPATMPRTDRPVSTQPIAAPKPAPRAASAPAGDKAARFAAMRARVIVCEKCPHLVKSRTQVVFGVGNIDAELMFVGEAPGADEDLQGEPFVGKAGQLLTKIIEAMGFTRGDIYIGNVLKCRPDMPDGESGNRKPTTSEMETCLPYLREQIDLIQPRVLVALGATAMQGLLNETASMASLRGRWHEFQGIPLMATYHPAYLLRNQLMSEKRKVWEDMLQVLEHLGKPVSEKQRNFFLQKA